MFGLLTTPRRLKEVYDNNREITKLPVFFLSNFDMSSHLGFSMFMALNLFPSYLFWFLSFFFSFEENF